MLLDAGRARSQRSRTAFPARESTLLGALLGLWVGGCAPAPPAAAPPSPRFAFQDVATAAGLRFVHSHGDRRPLDILHTTGSGLAWIDYDRDGYPDLLCVNGSSDSGTAGAPGQRLFRNRKDGTFEDVTARAGISGTVQEGMGAAVGDYDGDGVPDLYVTGFGGDRLFRNQGDGTFRDVTERIVPEAASRGSVPQWSTGAAWFDADGDGDLDLYVAGYCALTPQAPRYCTIGGQETACPPSHYEGQEDRFYRNEGGKRLRLDRSMFPRGNRPPGRGLGVLPADLDDDGQPELLVANDGGGNFLFRKHGDRYVEAAYACGVALSSTGADPAGMGVDAADVDGDGRSDLLLGNFQDVPNLFFRQEAPLQFHEVSAQVGLELPTRNVLTFGTGWIDGDQDGQLEALFINGHVQDNIQRIVSGVTWAQKPQLLAWRSGAFQDVSREAGPALQQELVGRGCAFADFDRDGDVDVAVSASGGAVQLWRNDCRRGHWLQVELRGHRPNVEAVGARVTVRAGAALQHQEVLSGRSYLSDSERVLTFGLGAAERVESIEIRWPDGSTQRVGASPADRRMVISEGKA